MDLQQIKITDKNFNTYLQNCIDGWSQNLFTENIRATNVSVYALANCNFRVVDIYGTISFFSTSETGYFNMNLVDGIVDIRISESDLQKAQKDNYFITIDYYSESWTSSDPTPGPTPDPTPDPSPNNYTVTVVVSGNGTAYANPTVAKAGTTISLNAVPDDGYVFYCWNSNGVILSNIGMASNSFIMPANNVTITAVFKLPTVIIHIDNSNNGGKVKFLHYYSGVGIEDWTVGPTVEEIGKQIQLKAFPDTGYYLKSWGQPNNITIDNNNTFIVPNTPDTPVTFHPEWALTDDTEYTITVTTDGNGTASASQTVAKAGTQITLTATPSSGYRFKEWQTSVSDITIDSNNTFIMSASNVTITAVFEKITTTQYTVTVGKKGEGTVSANPIIASAGTKIQLTAIPSDGYVFDSFNIMKGNITIKEDNTFIMPESDVIIIVNFKQDGSISQHTVTVTTDGNGTAKALWGSQEDSTISVVVGETVNLLYTPNSGYHFLNWEVTEGDITIQNNSFTMPTTPVKIKAFFKKDSTITTNFSLGVKLTPSNNGYTATRLEEAVDLSPGDDFNQFRPYGERVLGLYDPNNNIFISEDTYKGFAVNTSLDATTTAKYKWTTFGKPDGNGNYSTRDFQDQIKLVFQQPNFYYKIQTSSNSEITIYIRAKAADGYSLIFPYVEEDEYVYIAREPIQMGYRTDTEVEDATKIYTGQGGRVGDSWYYTLANTETTLYTADELKEKLTTNEYLYDYHCLAATQILYLIEYADLDIQNKIGVGYSGINYFNVVDGENFHETKISASKFNYKDINQKEIDKDSTIINKTNPPPESSNSENASLFNYTVNEAVRITTDGIPNTKGSDSNRIIYKDSNLIDDNGTGVTSDCKDRTFSYAYNKYCKHYNYRWEKDLWGGPFYSYIDMGDMVLKRVDSELGEPGKYLYYYFFGSSDDNYYSNSSIDYPWGFSLQFSPSALKVLPLLIPDPNQMENATATNGVPDIVSLNSSEKPMYLFVGGFFSEGVQAVYDEKTKELLGYTYYEEPYAGLFRAEFKNFFIWNDFRTMYCKKKEVSS